MPELPEVESLVRGLAERASGLTVTRCELVSISALKTFDPPLSSVEGRMLVGCTRRGKFLCLDLEGRFLVFHLARSGFLRWREELKPATARQGRGPLALRVGFDDRSGFELTEMSREKRLAIYVVDELTEVPGIARLGIDALDPGLDEDKLASLLSASSGTVKSVLADQDVIAGIGNAYSDEILHAARLSPFAIAARLDRDDVARVHESMVAILTEALERSGGLAASELKAEKKRGMKVHGRKGETCPDCGDVVREVSYATKSLQYCASCQTKGRVLADRRLSRLLR
jgi:formamidopyrimidine-DNA glycosylase